VTAPIPNRPRRELPPSPATHGRRSILPDADLAEELAQLAGLLAEVVILAGNSSVFPSRWRLIAELALETRQCASGAASRKDPTGTAGSQHVTAEHRAHRRPAT